MTLTPAQYRLLLEAFNASIKRAAESGIPIGKEYYNDIEEIKKQLYQKVYGT